MLQQYENILYCTGLADETSFAACHALSVAQQTGAKLHILHVAEPLSNEALLTIETYLDGFTNRKDFDKQRIQRAKDLLNERMEKLLGNVPEGAPDPKETVASVEVIAQAHPAEAILKRAKALNCDMIVMGMHQKGRSRAIIGSVSKQVVHLSSIPVMLVPLYGT